MLKDLREVLLKTESTQRNVYYPPKVSIDPFMLKFVAPSTLFPAVSNKSTISKENLQGKTVSHTAVSSPVLQKGNPMLSISQVNNETSLLRSPAKCNDTSLNKSSQNQSNE